MKTAGLKTTYSISNDSATVTTVAAKTNKWDRQTEEYLFPLFKESLQRMAFVTSVTQTKGAESTESNTWYDYETKKRNSHAFVTLSLSSPVTLLFQVEENFRKCKVPGTKIVVDDTGGGGGTSGTCQTQSALLVKGPVAVYGNFANSINVDALLRNKQELEFTLGKSWDRADTTIATRFNIKSVSFDDGLTKFFRIFNIPVFLGHEKDVGYGSGVLDKVSPLTSRQKLMLGISRITRQANERMLN